MHSKCIQTTKEIGKCFRDTLNRKKEINTRLCITHGECQGVGIIGQDDFRVDVFPRMALIGLDNLKSM